MFLRFKIFSITFLIIFGLHLFAVDSVSEEGQSSEDTSSLIRKTDPADSIFCTSEILTDVQMSGVLGDPETFVNLKLKNSKEETLSKYEELKRKLGPYTSMQFEEKELEAFVRNNFEVDKPKQCQHFQDPLYFEQILLNIADTKYRDFHQIINQIWPYHARETDADVAKNPEYHSLLDVPECYIQVGNSNGMPSYWQNYLIVRGTLANAMRATGAGIMRNIAHIIRKHGLAMYSNKTYYSTRSQLPLLALMVEDYLEAAEQDDEFLKDLLPAVEAEFYFWYNNRKSTLEMNGKEYLVFLYNQLANRPRPEHYKQDWDRSTQVENEKDREKFWGNLYSLDESGFEHTTRFRRAQPDGKRSYLDIRNIVPVELMSVLHRCASILSGWYISLKITHPEKAEEYQQQSDTFAGIAERILETITELLYNNEKGAWFDLHMDDKKQIEDYYPTNLLPMLTVSYDTSRNVDIGNKALTYLISEKIITEKLEPNYYLIPTSNERNGGPGDFPSGSLLLNVLVIEGLSDSDNYGTKLVAQRLASRLVRTVYDGFLKYGFIRENYNVMDQEYAATSTRESSAAAIGAVNLILKRFGPNITVAYYNDFKPGTFGESEASRKRPRDSTTEIGKPSGNSGDAEDETNKKSRTDTDAGKKWNENS